MRVRLCVSVAVVALLALIAPVSADALCRARPLYPMIKKVPIRKAIIWGAVQTTGCKGGRDGPRVDVFLAFSPRYGQWRYMSMGIHVGPPNAIWYSWPVQNLSKRGYVWASAYRINRGRIVRGSASIRW